MRKSANPDTPSRWVDVAGAGAQSLREPEAFVRMDSEDLEPLLFAELEKYPVPDFKIRPVLDPKHMKTWAALFRPLDACKGKRKRKGGGGKRK